MKILTHAVNNSYIYKGKSEVDISRINRCTICDMYNNYGNETVAITNHGLVSPCNSEFITCMQKLR